MGSPEDKVPQQDPPQEAQAPTPAAHPVIADPQPSDSFWARIRRHKVVEWTLAYAAFSYATLHLVEMLRDAFEWPAVVPRLTVFGLVLGTPVAMTLAWYHGHRAQHRVSRLELSILIALLLVAGSVLWLVSRHEPGAVPRVAMRATSAGGNETAEATFSPPPHSIAVLPFVNISGDKEQEYFSDGLTEELLNSLSRINELQVAARTSAFYFKGEHVDLPTIARKLNVASVLEGSVRRSGHTIRVTAQLNNAVTGFHLWSQTYDRDLGDVLALQADIANAVAEALKVSMLGDQTARIELGGTRNPAAFDAYLRASKAYQGALYKEGLKNAIAGYTEAIRLDPDYATAYAYRSIAILGIAVNWAKRGDIRDYRKRAQVDARKAIALAPDLADGHLALARLLEGDLEFMGASQEYQRAVARAPGSANVLRYYGIFAVQMGQTEAGLAAARRSVVLDPLNYQNHLALGTSELFARRNAEAILALRHAEALAPNHAGVKAWLGYAYYRSGDFQSARATCESADELNKPICLATVYDKLGHHSEAKTILAKYQAERGDDAALFYAMIYSQWGDTTRALDWLDTAVRRQDPYLELVKMAPDLDPLRKEPRFQAIERELKFPN